MMGSVDAPPRFTEFVSIQFDQVKLTSGIEPMPIALAVSHLQGVVAGVPIVC